MIWLLIGMAFLAGFLGVAGFYLVWRDRSAEGRWGESARLYEEFYDPRRSDEPKLTLFKDLSRMASETAEDSQSPLSLQRRLETLTEQAGLPIHPRTLIALMVVFGVGTAALGGFLCVLLGHHPLIGAAVGTLAACIPFLFVVYKRRSRLEKMLSQLPDALDSMVGAIRAGRSMTHAMQEVSEHFKAPLATEFAVCIAKQDMGLSPEAALRDLSARTGLLEIKILAYTLLIQRQTGGNFADLLDRLARIIRERLRVKGQIRTLTAEGRIQANVLIALPFALLGILLFLSPNYAQVLFTRTDLLFAGLGGMAIGVIWIRRIVSFDF